MLRQFSNELLAGGLGAHTKVRPSRVICHVQEIAVAVRVGAWAWRHSSILLTFLRESARATLVACTGSPNPHVHTLGPEPLQEHILRRGGGGGVGGGGEGRVLRLSSSSLGVNTRAWSRARESVRASALY